MTTKAVSPPDPFAGGCGNPNAEDRGKEDETTIAVNPRNPRNLIAGWRQDGVRGGTTLDMATVTSADGGRSWRHVRLQGTTGCSGAPSWPMSSDPTVSFGPEGTAYLASEPMRRKPDGLPLFELTSRVLVNRSTNGGRSWAAPKVIIDDGGFNDKPIVVADPTTRGRAYVVWFKRDLPSNFPAAVPDFRTYLSRTTDGGRHWSKPKPIFSDGPNCTLGQLIGEVQFIATSKAPAIRCPDAASAFGQNLLVLPDGSLVLVYEKVSARPAISFQLTAPEEGTEAEGSDGFGGPQNGPAPIMAIRSSDHGKTWSAPVLISDQHDSFVASDPDTGEPKNDGAAWFATAASGADGTMYAVWQDILSPRSSALRMSRSSDGGRSWTKPSIVADQVERAQAIRPTVAVMDDGTVGVSYFDDRNDAYGDRPWTVDAWMRYSRDRGRHWSEVHLGGPFDYRPEEVQPAEYQGLVALPDGFGAAFVQGRPRTVEGPTDIFFSRVRLSPFGKPKHRVPCPRTTPAGRRSFRLVCRHGGGRRSDRRAGLSR